MLLIVHEDQTCKHVWACQLFLLFIRKENNTSIKEHRNFTYQQKRWLIDPKTSFIGMQLGGQFPIKAIYMYMWFYFRIQTFWYKLLQYVQQVGESLGIFFSASNIISIMFISSLKIIVFFFLFRKIIDSCQTTWTSILNHSGSCSWVNFRSAMKFWLVALFDEYNVHRHRCIFNIHSCVFNSVTLHHGCLYQWYYCFYNPFVGVTKVLYVLILALKIYC